MKTERCKHRWLNFQIENEANGWQTARHLSKDNRTNNQTAENGDKKSHKVKLYRGRITNTPIKKNKAGYTAKKQSLAGGQGQYTEGRGSQSGGRGCILGGQGLL